MALNNKATGKPVFNDERTRNKIDLHLRDINDEITEKDIENVQTDVTISTDEEQVSAEKTAEEILEKKKQEEKERDDKDTDGNNSNSIGTPWNVLD